MMPSGRSLGVALLAALAACGTLTGPANQALADAKAKWAERGAPSYDYVTTRLCFCVWENRAIAVSVRNGQIASATFVDSGAPVGATLMPYIPTVPDLFDMIDEARAAKAVVLSTAYDPTYGYPVRIQIDYSAAVADDEVTVTAQGLTLFSALQQRP